MGWGRGGLLLATLLALGGCGFHPLYARHGRTGYDPVLASIKVNTIPDRQGQVLAIALRDGLNPQGARMPTRYTLDVHLESTRQNIAIRPDGTASRSEVAMTASYVLKDVAKSSEGAIVLSGTTHSVSAFDVLADNYATVVAQHAAEERTLSEVGDDILTRLELFVSKHRSASAPS
jgi:LPS-assembly lipoprotein